MNNCDSHEYDDIIDLPNPTSHRHPRMSLYNRAAQFSPFAALTGYEAAIKETERLTDEQVTLSEDAAEELDYKLGVIEESIGMQKMVTITFFVPDERKTGGAYITQSGIVKRIDEYEHTVVMTDSTIIPIGQISVIEGELF